MALQNRNIGHQKIRIMKKQYIIPQTSQLLFATQSFIAASGGGGSTETINGGNGMEVGDEFQ